MRNSPKKYAEVLVSVLTSASSEAEIKDKAKKLKLILQKRGEVKLAGDILREFSRAWAERMGPIAKIISATPIQEKTREKIYSELKARGYVPKESIDESLIGGLSVFLGNQYLIDTSYRGKLRKLEKIIQASHE